MGSQVTPAAASRSMVAWRSSVDRAVVQHVSGREADVQRFRSADLGGVVRGPRDGGFQLVERRDLRGPRRCRVAEGVERRPALAAGHRPAHCRLAVAADPDRRCGRRDGPQANAAGGERRALVGDVLAGEHLVEHVERLVEECAAVVEIDSEGAEFGFEVARGGADDQAVRRTARARLWIDLAPRNGLR